MGFKDENEKERMDFVDLWGKFVLENDDKVWSRQQNVIINSCLSNKLMKKEDYLKMKG
ncbi:MAG: hypothetical protein ABIJ18_02600 [archaeon]